MICKGTISYTKIEPDVDLGSKLQQLAALGVQVNDVLYIDTEGKVTFQRLSGDKEPIELGSIALEGLVNGTIRNTFFGSQIVICEEGGEPYLTRMLNLARINGYASRPIG